MKRIVSLVLTMMLVFSCMAPVAYAGSAATVTVTETVNRGEDVTVTYTLPDSVTDVIYLMLDIKFDAAVFEYKSAVATGWTVIPTSAGVCFTYETAKMEGGDDLSGQTVTAVLTCKADAEGGDHTITASVRADESYGETVDEIVIADVNDTVNVYVPHEHQKSATSVPADEPSCFEDGTIEYWTCTGCDAKLNAAGEVITDITDPATGAHVFEGAYGKDATQHWKGCTTTGCTAEGPKSGHEFSWVETKPATMYVAGEEQQQCACGATGETREIPANTPARPTATVGEAVVSAEMPLSVSAKFTAVEPTAEQQEYYNNWYVDFVLTSNKDIDLTGKNYLAGEYGTYGWVKIDGDAVPSIKAGEPLKIVESGLGGMKMKYKEIWETVKEFQCGVYLAPEFLLANEDIELTLALNLYDREGKVYTIVEKTYEPASVALPEATVGEAEVSAEMPLSVSAKFTAVEPTAEQKAAYDNWYVDFVLTSNKDIDLTGKNYLAGEYGTYGWVKIDGDAVPSIKAGEPLKIVESGLGGMKMKYKEIWETVKEFQCGVYLAPEFLLANEDIELTLALNLYDRSGKVYTLVEEVYTAEPVALPEAIIGDATVSEEMPLTVATKFTAVEPTAEQQAAYDNWYADFVLTANKDIPLTEGNYLAGEYGTYGWIKIDGEAIPSITAGEPLKIVESGLGGMKMKYKEIWETVKEFQCGLFLTPEFLEANADLEIELVLNLYDREGNVYPIAVFEYQAEEPEEEPEEPEEPEVEPERPTRPRPSVKDEEPAEEPKDDVIIVTEPEVEEAEAEDTAVVLDIEPLRPNSMLGGNTTINIKLPVDAGKVEVEIPVENVTPGTVVVIVHEDGTEEIINSAVMTENGLVVELEGEVTVKVVNKALTFVDVHGVNHWATKHIDFVTARGLYNGTSATTFSPDELTTRGQLMTVLARLDGAKAASIADGVKWAVENGISDGSNPEGAITRQDVAVMLWRYAGNLVSTYDISGYTDAADVAQYAELAIAWAGENGIMTGYPDGTLLPLANATRAHVATMVERLVNNIK